MAKKAIWISYDLGVKGDYESLYAWLDEHEAIECGNSVAFIKFEYSRSPILELEKSLKTHINFKPTDRVYVIMSVIVSGKRKIQGKFLLGKRKGNPWEGFGSSSFATIDGDE